MSTYVCRVSQIIIIIKTVQCLGVGRELQLTRTSHTVYARVRLCSETQEFGDASRTLLAGPAIRRVIIPELRE